jgi:hypothetical protein
MEQYKESDEDKRCEALDRILHRSIIKILSIAAPSLYTLSLYIDCRSWLFFPFPSSFPLLTELSIKHPFKADLFRSDALIPLKTCPSLKKLVLTGFKCVFDPQGVIGRINTFGPNITHLCVPFNAHNTQVMLQFLKQGMTPSPSLSASTTFPQSLERLFVHSLSDAYDPLRRVFPIFPTGTKRVVLVERTWGNRTVEKVVGNGTEAHLMWESMWANGIDGGEGYWVYPHGYSEGSESSFSCINCSSYEIIYGYFTLSVILDPIHFSA